MGRCDFCGRQSIVKICGYKSMIIHGLIKVRLCPFCVKENKKFIKGE